MQRNYPKQVFYVINIGFPLSLLISCQVISHHVMSLYKTISSHLSIHYISHIFNNTSVTCKHQCSVKFHRRICNLISRKWFITEMISLHLLSHYLAVTCIWPSLVTLFGCHFYLAITCHNIWLSLVSGDLLSHYLAVNNNNNNIWLSLVSGHLLSLICH